MKKIGSGKEGCENGEKKGQVNKILFLKILRDVEKLIQMNKSFCG